MDGRRRCRPSPSQGALEGAPDCSRALRGTFCSRLPGDDRCIIHICVDGVTYLDAALIPPTRGSRAHTGYQCVFPGEQPGSHSVCSLSPSQSKHRQSCQQAGRESSADPDASGDEMSSCLQ